MDKEQAMTTTRTEAEALLAAVEKMTPGPWEADDPRAGKPRRAPRKGGR
jgi:hypothetical protein